MPYVGKTPVVGNFVKLDAIVTSATATYNLLNGGVAYFPQTANNCIVSLNGVIQSPTSAYTISGSTIVFDSALTSADSIDFILVLGDVLAIGTPSDGTVTNAKIAASTIDLTTKVTGTLPVANGGTNLSSGFFNGITEADQWRLSSNLTNASGVNDITTNLERNDTDFSLIGTGMTQSSGVFTFPSTGIYLVTVFSTAYNDLTNAYGGIYINFTTNNSSYNTRCFALGAGGAAGEYQTVAGNVVLDVTNTSTHKVKFQVSSPTSFTLSGSTSVQYTGFTFIRLGDT